MSNLKIQKKSEKYQVGFFMGSRVLSVLSYNSFRILKIRKDQQHLAQGRPKQGRKFDLHIIVLYTYICIMLHILGRFTLSALSKPASSVIDHQKVSTRYVGDAGLCINNIRNRWYILGRSIKLLVVNGFWYYKEWSFFVRPFVWEWNKCSDRSMEV